MRRSLVVALLLVALARPAVAQSEPTGAPFQFSDGPVTGLRLASATSDRVLAHWGDLNGLAGRVLASTGTANERLALPGKGCSGSEVVASPSADRYLRVWNQRVADADPVFGAGVLAQTQTADGRGVGAPFRIAAPQMGFCNFDAVTAWNSTTSQYIVVYRRGEPSGATSYYAQPVSTAPALQGDPFPIASGNVQKPAVAVLPADGSILAVWPEAPAGGRPGSTILRGRLHSSAGAKLGGVFTVSEHVNRSGAVENLEPQIAVNPATSEALVAWTDRNEVMGRLLGPDGEPRTDDMRLSRMGNAADPAPLTGSVGAVFNPEAEQFLVTWESHEPPKAPSASPPPVAVGRAFGQLLGRGALPIGTDDFPISPTPVAAQPRSVAVQENPSFVVGWENRAATVTGVARRILPTFGVGVVERPSIRAFARRGIQVLVQCPAACRARARLTISDRSARRLGGRTLALGSARRARAGGILFRLRVRASVARELRRLGRVYMTLRVGARDRAGRVRGDKRLVKLVR